MLWLGSCNWILIINRPGFWSGVAEALALAGAAVPAAGLFKKKEGEGDGGGGLE